MTDEKRDDDNDDDKAVAVVIPQLGEAVEEATMAQWLVRSGDHVLAEQPLVTLELDKICVELPAPVTGMFVMGAGVPGDVVKIGDVVGRIVTAPSSDPAREQRHDELLAAIAAAPDDDGARQVYADFLLEDAGPLRTWGADTTAMRGEYLALVARLKRPVERTDGDDDVPTTTSLRTRRDALASVAHSTAVSLVTVGGDLRVVDGFVAGIRGDLPSLEGRLAKLVRQAPITQLEITGLVEHDTADRVLALPGLEHLHALALQTAKSMALPAGEVARIVGSPRLGTLARLELRGLQLGAEEGHALATSTATTLELHDCELALGDALGERGFDRLVIGPANADGLRSLVARPLQTLRLVGPGTVPVIDAAAFARVTALELERLVVRSPLPALETTSLVRVAVDRCTFVDPRGLYTWLHTLPKTLARLEIRSCAVGDRPAKTFADEIRARTTAYLVL